MSDVDKEGVGGDKRFVTLSEAARMNNVTRQAIYVAIKQKKLRAYKNPTRWIIDIDDLDQYKKLRYSRSKSMHNGELVFDNHKGFYSIQQASRMLDVPYQKIYYATRIGLLKASRKGSAWIVHVDDLKKYQESYLNKMISNFDESVS